MIPLWIRTGMFVRITQVSSKPSLYLTSLQTIDFGYWKQKNVVFKNSVAKPNFWTYEMVYIYRYVLKYFTIYPLYFIRVWNLIGKDRGQLSALKASIKFGLRSHMTYSWIQRQHVWRHKNLIFSPSRQHLSLRTLSWCVLLG